MPDPAAPQSQPHVLVVDDEANSAWALAYILRHKGYRVTTAGDGMAALEAYKADPADAVITDMRMPKLDGTELIRRLRESSQTLPIIVMTGYVPFGEEEKNEDAGPLVVLKKPISVEELLQVLRRLMASSTSD